jgi:hypothetical protein
MIDKTDCSYEGKTLSHGSEACSIDLCVRCDDGNVVLSPDLVLPVEELQADSGEAYFTPLS